MSFSIQIGTIAIFARGEEAKAHCFLYKKQSFSSQGTICVRGYRKTAAKQEFLLRHGTLYTDHAGTQNTG